MNKLPSVCTALLFLLSACASTSIEEADPLSVSKQNTGLTDGELSQQELAPGECGLFLWRRGSQSRFIFFAKAGQETAAMLFEDIERELMRTGIQGDIFGQFLTRMSYETVPPGMRVDLTLEPGEIISGGQKVSAGSITVTDSQGWETILPIAGVRACQPD